MVIVSVIDLLEFLKDIPSAMMTAEGKEGLPFGGYYWPASIFTSAIACLSRPYFLSRDI
jgi:hypothetical protein